MAEDETLHYREFHLRVEFTDKERETFFERLMWEGDLIGDAIISEVTSNLKDVGLRPTIERVH